MADNQAYYDTFSETYDRGRDQGYHRFLDEAEVSVASPWLGDVDVLEVGCGTGLILERLGRRARSAVGVDLSPGMLERARARGLEVHQSDASSLPFDDESFDLVVSFKVLAHVEDIGGALREIHRVLRPGGHAVLEFYNRRSLRTLVKGLTGPRAIGETLDEGDVYLRYDTRDEVLETLPEGLSLVRWDGIRILSPVALPFDLPAIGPLWCGLERAAMKTPLSRFGGFLLATLERSA